MKRFFGILLVAIIISFSFSPSTSFAVETDDPEFNAFLEEIGWEAQEYTDYLESKEWRLEEFWDVDELGTPLTEESVEAVLEEFELSRDELNQLLVDNSDIVEGQDVLEGNWLIFEEELHEYVDIYLNGWTGTPIEDDNLQGLLDFYGFESREDLENYLNEYGESTDDYEFIEDLEITLDYYAYEDVEAYEDEMLPEDMDAFFGQYDDFLMNEAYGMTGNALLDAMIGLTPALIQMLLN